LTPLFCSSFPESGSKFKARKRIIGGDQYAAGFDEFVDGQQAIEVRENFFTSNFGWPSDWSEKNEDALFKQVFCDGAWLMFWRSRAIAIVPHSEPRQRFRIHGNKLVEQSDFWYEYVDRG
jgi:hypothetical protein